MNIPDEFADIRPFEPEELPEVYERLLHNEQFLAVLHYLFPQQPVEQIAALMRQQSTNLDFQRTFCYPFLENLLREKSTGCTIDASAVDTKRNYTFVSNHRDIVLDSALLDKLLIDAGFQSTCEIAIGDNLLSLPWVKDVVRINKSFIVERSLNRRQLLLSSKRLSDYMHFVAQEKKDNIWIAQREGRAKDSNDRTQPAILKMMSMGGEGSAVERLKQLNIVPLAISYQFDPCDYLKAREMQLRRDNPDWQKGPTDDIVSMKTGILGYKGEIHYECAPCINDYLSTLSADIPTNEIFDLIASHMDQEIFSRYRLYPENFIAWDLLEGNQQHADQYTSEQAATFREYLQQQLQKIDIEQPDEDFLCKQLLTMYANPAKNKTAGA